MSEFAVMPISDYVRVCDSVREKTGGTEAIKSSEMSQKIDDVYSAGKQAESDSFWDAFQNNGDEQNYYFAFSNGRFTDGNYNPKYDLLCVSTANTSSSNLFYNNTKITDTKVGIICSTRSSAGLFQGATSLETIRKLTVFETSTFTNSFQNCSKLKNIVIEGTIGQSISFNNSPLTPESMKSVISHLKNYSPNEDVYRIEDDLAWISAYEIAKNGVKNNPNVGLGDSRHSISINNPELLLSFIVPQFNEGIDKNNFSTTSYFHPTKILWNKKERTIEAFFDITAFKKHHPKFQEVTMYPDETNARDFGYNWVYAPESMGLFFKDRQNNIERRLYRMQGYYHKGYSCGLKEGCNNYSPYQEDMVFTIIDTGYLKLKLWKNKPLSVLKNADMTYIMHFE